MSYSMYRQIPLKKRKKLKIDLLKLKENYIKQNEKLTLLFLKANHNSIKAIDDLINNKISLEQFKHTTKLAQEYKSKVYKLFNLGGK
ncbi:hypothetical protein LCGC14_2168930 [marine sediment metagenome]|uniref:Uncharacterized protein n=1 Tax=marine sediment metagenome TaxID=412755 RepID=A0A0F8XJF9_9ZZZZ